MVQTQCLILTFLYKFIITSVYYKVTTHGSGELSPRKSNLIIHTINKFEYTTNQ